MKSILFSAVVVMALALGAFALTPVGEKVEVPETELKAILEVPAALHSGDAVNLRFTLINNSDSQLYVLKWYTPLEGIAGEIFRIEREGEVIPYEGILAYRGDPPPDAYVLLGPGESVSAEVDLATAYDFSKAGEYTIEFLSPSISYVARTEAKMAKTVDDLAPVEIPSNRVAMEIGGSSEEDEAGTSQGSATDSNTTVTISSTSGPSGTLVQVVASGFPPNTPVSVGVGPVGWQFSEVVQGTTDANGVFTVYLCGNNVCWTR